MNARSRFSQSSIRNGQTAKSKRKKKKKAGSPVQYRSMPEGLILSQTSAFRLPPPFWHGPIYASIQIKSGMMFYRRGFTLPDYLHCYFVYLHGTCVLLFNKKVSQIYFFKVLYTQSSQLLRQSHEVKLVGYCMIFHPQFSLHLLQLIYLIFLSNEDRNETVTKQNPNTLDRIQCICGRLFCVCVLLFIEIVCVFVFVGMREKEQSSS